MSIYLIRVINIYISIISLTLNTGMKICPNILAQNNSILFYVKGQRKDEIANTGRYNK